MRKRTSKPVVRLLALGLVGAVVVLFSFACGGPGGGVDVYCRDNPGDCPGEIGGGCFDDRDCLDGICCQSDHCGGGMCTYPCGSDVDCPESMGCEHGVCFFYCAGKDGCGPGQKCEHGNTVCEY
jgi:hypothetical protein